DRSHERPGADGPDVRRAAPQASRRRPRRASLRDTRRPSPARGSGPGARAAVPRRCGADRAVRS
ncbi:MAG: hypothetical protein AVDCRST_MAG32-2890, partial [uncultured Nocardioides sp.]